MRYQFSVTIFVMRLIRRTATTIEHRRDSIDIVDMSQHPRASEQCRADSVSCKATKSHLSSDATQLHACVVSRRRNGEDDYANIRHRCDTKGEWWIFFSRGRLVFLLKYDTAAWSFCGLLIISTCVYLALILYSRSDKNETVTHKPIFRSFSSSLYRT